MVCATKYAAKISATVPVILCVVSNFIGLVRASTITAPAKSVRTNFSRKTGTAELCHSSEPDATGRLLMTLASNCTTTQASYLPPRPSWICYIREARRNGRLSYACHQSCTHRNGPDRTGASCLCAATPWRGDVRGVRPLWGCGGNDCRTFWSRGLVQRPSPDAGGPE